MLTTQVLRRTQAGVTPLVTAVGSRFFDDLFSSANVSSSQDLAEVFVSSEGHDGSLLEGGGGVPVCF